MPDVGNIDTMTPCRSSQTSKPSASVRENNRQQQEASATKSKKLTFKKTDGVFSMVALATVSGLDNTFQYPTTSIDNAVALMSVVNQYFDGTINLLHQMALTTKN